MNGTRIADAVVIGGGPAGLAAAIAARQRGLDVAVVERLAPPIDKACGEGVMPEGVALLARLGVDLEALAGAPLVGIEFIGGEVLARAHFRRARGRGLRRTVLHAALVRRATELGVELLWRRTVRGLGSGGVLLDDGPLAARWILGADGMNSAVRRWAGLDAPPARARVGIRRHFEIAPWTDLVQVYWADGAEAYVTPVDARAVCVAVLADAPVPHFDAALARFPALAARLGSAAPLGESRGSGTVFRRARGVVAGRVALVGDAAASADAITGLGITLAARQALLLADGLAREDLSSYERLHPRLMRVALGMSSFMLAVHDRPRLRRGVLRALSAAPWLFSGLLSLHTQRFPIDDVLSGSRAA